MLEESGEWTSVAAVDRWYPLYYLADTGLERID